MDARWAPASTARTEPLAQLEAVERTRNPVALSSLGPPDEPYTSGSAEDREQTRFQRLRKSVCWTAAPIERGGRV